MNTNRIATLAALGVLLAACGAKTANAPAAEPEVEATCPACFSDRWEQPPPGIGQTPPEESAPITMIENFENPARDGSGADSADEGSGEGSASDNSGSAR